MRKTLSFIIILFIINSTLQAQKDAPKWVEKLKPAVFTIITYDKNDNILNTGHGFFTDENGSACSDYTLFLGAERAIIITSDEKQFEVKSIVGINEMYDLIKFEVETPKKVIALDLASAPLQQGNPVFLLSYSPKKERNIQQGEIEEVSTFSGGYNYYTIQLEYNENFISCPLLSHTGEVIGLIQRNSFNDTAQCYAIDASFANKLSFNALSINNKSLNKIGIKKSLPETEEQALIYLLISSTDMESEKYLSILNEFIEKFPNSSEGYLRRALFYIDNFEDRSHYEKAEQDLNKAESISKEKDNIYYNIAKINYSYALKRLDINYKDWGLEKALKENSKALAIDSLPLYIQQRGDIYFAMQSYDQAYIYYDKVNRTNLVSPTTYYSVAKTKQLMEADMQEVIALMDSAISLFVTPLSLEAAPFVFERAQLKMDNNMFKEAVEDFDLYYDIVNGRVNDVFFYYREQANYHSNNFTRALEDINRAVELSPEDPIYLAELGAVNLRIANFAIAIENLQTALKFDPEFAACYRLIGYCQVQLKDTEKACENFAKAKELGDEAVENMIQRYCQ